MAATSLLGREVREEVGKDGGNNKGEDAERKEGEWQESTWESNRKL